MPAVVPVDDDEVLRGVELAGLRVHGLEHLGVLVVGHGLGGVDLAVEQGDHVELLLHQRDVGARVEPGFGHAGEQLELVAEAPVADVACRSSSSGVSMPDSAKRDLQRAGALEDLADVGDRGALLAGGQRLGHPGDGEVGFALGEHRLGNDVDAALEDLEVDALLLVEPERVGGEEPGELALGEPLQLQPSPRRSSPPPPAVGGGA